MERFPMIKISKVILLSLFYSTCAYSWDLRGYLKTYLENFSDENKKMFNGDDSAASISARASVLNSFSDKFSFEGSYQIVPYYGLTLVQAYNVRNINLKSYRAVDLPLYIVEPQLGSSNTFSLLQNLDRLFFTYTDPKIVATLGRQIVTFGSAKIVNPTDVVTPFGLNTIDTEERAGSDAARIKYFIDNFYVDVGMLFGKDFYKERNGIFTRLGWTQEGQNFYLMAMEFRGENQLFGFNWEGGIGGSTYWLETSYVNGTKNDEKDYTRLSAGTQYYFGNDWSVIGEYHYNGIGTYNKNDYVQVAIEPSFIEANLFLVGKNYFSLMFSKKLSPLWDLNFGGTMNLNDQSILLNALLVWNLTQNSYLEGGLFPGTGSPGSEFNLYPNIFYLGYRIYF